MARVSYADLWGLRDGKYRYLLENDVSTTDWQTLEALPPDYFFVPRNLNLATEYSAAWSVRDIFPLNSTNVETGRDKYLVAFERETVTRVARAITDPSITADTLQERYGIRDTSGWPVAKRREAAVAEGFREERIVSIYYRPFDWRYVYFSSFLRRAHEAVMRHMLLHNLALVTTRQVTGASFNNVLACAGVAEYKVSSTDRNSYLFPLYVYHLSDQLRRGLFDSAAPERDPNLSPDFIAAVADKLLLDFVPDGKGDLENTFGPQDIFHYMYAVFHSPTYRERYAEFLKIDFPRLPLTSDLDLFRALAGKGEELVALHLMESARLNELITAFPVSDSNEVEKVRYAETSEERPGRVYINKTQYFEGVEPGVWEFHIGGYQVLHKWLKDRKGRKLSFDDVYHYQKIVVALTETMRLMEEIDELIPSWPIE